MTVQAPPDRRPRCAWAGQSPLYTAYHDDEWGRPVHGEQALFERLTLEAFQSGLSWLTILRKRAAFRSAFAEFAVDAVAGFNDDDVARLMLDEGIVRNRAKIVTTIGNARAIRSNIDDLDSLLWSFAPAGYGSADEADGATPGTWHAPSRSAASRAMSKELKRLGLGFVGPITCHSLMAAVGMVNDHAPECFRHEHLQG